MIRPNRAWRTAMVLATASLALTACGGSNNSDNARATTAAPRATSTSAPAAKGDGTLTVGTLLPQTGDLAFLGPPEFAGVRRHRRHQRRRWRPRQGRRPGQGRLR